jgi:cytochrome c-type biogenesis protein CcsB
MNRLLKFLTSPQLMGALFILLSTVLAVATFIENDFGNRVARALIYNTLWFELIFLLLAINMFGNLFVYNLWRWKKAPVLLFHLSFFIILAGSAVTRYLGYEGSMPIREGETTNTFYTVDGYVTVEISDDAGTRMTHEPVFLSPSTPGEFSEKIEVNGHPYHIKSTEYTPYGVVRPVKSPEGSPLLGLLITSSHQRQEHFLSPGEMLTPDSLQIAFEPTGNIKPDVTIRRSGEETLTISSRLPLHVKSMEDQQEQTIDAGQRISLETETLYVVNGTGIALSRFFPSAEYRPVSIPQKSNAAPPDVVSFEVTNDKINKNLYVSGDIGRVGNPESLMLNGGTIHIRYGSLPLKLPFSIRLNNFELERYPGSDSPASYACEVTLIDPEHNTTMDFRIFMNNILNYGGFRFYQSSYDQDEKGTILAVNHDFWGTLITYVGYFLLTVGMLWSLLAPNTRFRQLMRKTDKIYHQRKGITLLLMLIISISGMAQNMPPRPNQEAASTLGELWVQDKMGRIKPLNTMHQEIMVKMVKHNSFQGFSPDQMLLGMLTHPAKWQLVPLITIKHPELKQILGITGKKAAFRDFFDRSRNYKIDNLVNQAYRKDPPARSKLEQELIKVDEQVNVFYRAQSGELHRLFPANNDPNKAWLTPTQSPEDLSQKDSVFVVSAMPSFIVAMREGNHRKALEVLNDIKIYQEVNGSQMLPSETKRNTEILYNRLNIFMWLATFFFLLGIFLIFYNITALVYPVMFKGWIQTLSKALVIGGFAYHTFGMLLRWYIAGHAPWSNGYESMIFIGWALLLAGLLFSRRSPLVLSVTAFFAGVMLMVSHLSWMNPEITNLVPVLKSHWLTLHVAVIIGGYGFMTLAALLGFMNLLLMSLQTPRNRKHLSFTIEELSAINEMALIIGLYLMTIGSFLGGIWANESWGRYWGWDPKETWSLITILIYAFVVHMRLIPGFRGRLAFNTASLLAFASVIMTYLGVNYYLSGMHSYAGGNLAPIPAAVYYIVVIVVVLIGFASRKERKIIQLSNN